MADKIKKSKKHEMKYVFDKHLHFTSGSMTEKSVRSLPGVEETLGERLVDGGFVQAYQLFGHYLVLRRDNARFIDWMMLQFGASKREATNCCFALEVWGDKYL